MTTDVKIDYIITEDGTHVGWATDYPGIIAQGKDLKEITENILKYLRAYLLFFIDELDDSNVDTIAIDRTSKYKKSGL